MCDDAQPAEPHDRGRTTELMAAPAKRRRRPSVDEQSRRNAHIRELYGDGWTLSELVDLTGRDERTVRRAVAGVVPRMGRGPTPAGELRQDRRRNGRLYAAWEPETHDDSLDLDAEEGA